MLGTTALGNAVLRWTLLAAGCAAVMAGAPASAAGPDDVVMFNRPPTVEELGRALGAGQPQRRTRSIVIDDAAPGEPVAAVPSPPAAPAVTPASAAAPYVPAAPKATPAAVPQAPRQQQAARPQTASPATATVSEKAVGMPIQFELNAATVTADSEPFVNVIAEFLRKEQGSQLIIEGHTDASGSYGHNVQLSRSRAVAVRDLLVNKHGIAPARLTVLGRGPSEPLDAADPLNPRNRRVQFRVRS